MKSHPTFGTSVLLSLRDIEACYGGVQVLWGLSLEVAAGEVCCVLGPNGAGKTTMARVVAGTLPITGGSASFDGRDLHRRTPEARARAGIAQAPQGRRVFPDLTVVENLQVARFAARGRADNGTPAFVNDLFPKLATLKRMPAGRLSGGEQQMLAVGRALMTEPRLLVLDEPSLGLAPLLVTQLYEAIARIRDRGVAILLIEQVVEAALGVGDRVVVLESGRVVAQGPVAAFDTDTLAHAYLGGQHDATGQGLT